MKFKHFRNGTLVERRTGDNIERIAQPIARANRIRSRIGSVKTRNTTAMAVARVEWPLWAKLLKLVAKPEDKGIGDVVARVIGNENSAAYKAWYKKIFGKTCGCSGRQADWNRRYPLNTQTP